LLLRVLFDSVALEVSSQRLWKSKVVKYSLNVLRVLQTPLVNRL